MSWWKYNDSNLTNAGYLTGLFILYLSTMLYTFHNLKRLGIHLQAEEKAILWQFTVFAVSYVTRAIYKFAVNYIETDYYHKTHLIEAVLVLLWNPAPITYVLCLHYRSFNNSLR